MDKEQFEGELRKISTSLIPTLEPFGYSVEEVRQVGVGNEEAGAVVVLKKPIHNSSGSGTQPGMEKYATLTVRFDIEHLRLKDVEGESPNGTAATEA